MSTTNNQTTSQPQKNNADIDGLPLNGVSEVARPNRDTISLTIQRENNRVTRHFEGDYQALYAHAMASPNVVLYEIGEE